MIIVVSGFAGSGKSTLAKRLAQRYKLKCVHASSLLKELREKNMEAIRGTKTEAGSGWWESEEGRQYMEERLENTQMDEELDKELLRIAEQDDVVLDSWTMPWLLKQPAVKIWLNASPDVRAERVAHRDSLPVEEVETAMRERDEKTAAIYKKLYGFDLGEDFSPFDKVIDTDDLDEDGVFEEAVGAVEEKNSLAVDGEEE